MEAREIGGLETALGHRFHRPELLEQALTHSSHAREVEASARENGVAVPDNEQLEFLGDAVLGFIASQELFRRFPHFDEGQLSKTRAYLVSESHLIRTARQLQLGRFLRLGRGEEKSGGRSKTTLLVDALEAVLAALFLDAGLEQARAFVLDHILEPELERLGGSSAGLPVTDYKSALQEAAHSAGWSPPRYVLVKERGPEHQKTFTIEAQLDSAGPQGKQQCVVRGEGPSKKQAEQSAARKALDHIHAMAQEKPKSRGRRTDVA
jgi:ribonuclease-3